MCARWRSRACGESEGRGTTESNYDALQGSAHVVAVVQQCRRYTVAQR